MRRAFFTFGHCLGLGHQLSKDSLYSDSRQRAALCIAALPVKAHRSFYLYLLSILLPTIPVGSMGYLENIKFLSQETSSKVLGSSTLKTKTTPSATRKETSTIAGNSWTKFWPVSSIFKMHREPPLTISPEYISCKVGLYRVENCLWRNWLTMEVFPRNRIR